MTISTAFNSGGFWMYSILAVQIVSIAIIIERVISLYVLRSPNQRALARKFEQNIKRGDIEEVINTARRAGNQPLSVVTQAGAQAALDFGGREEIQSKMDELLLIENARLEKRTGFLAMLANVGTLLGLLGTIVGLIQAFGSISNVNPVEKAQILTNGIALAMNTTAYGLIMAIPALIMYAVLQNRASELAEDLNQAALRVFNQLSFNFETVPRSEPKRRTSSRKA